MNPLIKIQFNRAKVIKWNRHLIASYLLQSGCPNPCGKCKIYDSYINRADRWSVTDQLSCLSSYAFPSIHTISYVLPRSSVLSRSSVRSNWIKESLLLKIIFNDQTILCFWFAHDASLAPLSFSLYWKMFSFVRVVFLFESIKQRF
jgi:hypothetical protein